ncbi:hypothetical protein AVEN_52856-1 [Araneus ventricosus]|uniref:Uncharacterized protein n=1 Tax=Araneus ventricosus TaxID=182803 RepID=A0A4Y2N4R9_ARAVE|nr:hypothetical protein AVEN_52856-1 [Araneus ventricosus]
MRSRGYKNFMTSASDQNPGFATAIHHNDSKLIKFKLTTSRNYSLGLGDFRLNYNEIIYLLVPSKSKNIHNYLSFIQHILSKKCTKCGEKGVLSTSLKTSINDNEESGQISNMMDENSSDTIPLSFRTALSEGYYGCLAVPPKTTGEKLNGFHCLLNEILIAGSAPLRKPSKAPRLERFWKIL